MKDLIRSSAFVLLVLLPTVTMGQPEDKFDPVTLIPKPFAAIKDAPVFEANSEKLKLEDDELVLGVEIDGQARAYPINMLKGPYREIINDRLGETDIAATW